MPVTMPPKAQDEHNVQNASRGHKDPQFSKGHPANQTLYEILCQRSHSLLDRLTVIAEEDPGERQNRERELQ
jgi:hypothetical protein